MAAQLPIHAGPPRRAGLPGRALATLIDLAVLAAAAYLVLDELPWELTAHHFSAIAAAVFVGVFLGFPAVTETLTGGRSPGKWALGLRVVREDGGPIRFWQALTRKVAGLFDAVRRLSAFFGSLRVVTTGSLGDILARTVVVDERALRCAATDPVAADPVAADPGAADPGAADPGAADPGAVAPGAEPRFEDRHRDHKLDILDVTTDLLFW